MGALIGLSVWLVATFAPTVGSCIGVVFAVVLLTTIGWQLSTDVPVTATAHVRFIIGVMLGVVLAVRARQPKGAESSG